MDNKNTQELEATSADARCNLGVYIRPYASFAPEFIKGVRLRVEPALESKKTTVGDLAAEAESAAQRSTETSLEHGK